MVNEEEEEAVISNVKKDTNTCSDSKNKRIGDDNSNLNQVWKTWDELVLSYAVKRHGLQDWDSISKEVRSQSRTSFHVSAEICKLKYQDLKRRFQDSGDGERNTEEDGEIEIPWLEELRSLRVDELRREVQRCDESILSIQLKVKKLEEEKGNDEDKKADLEDDDSNAIRSRKPARLNRETTESNRSMNESNSTASVDKIADNEQLNGDKIVRACENSSNPDPDPEMKHSGELNESGTSIGRGKKKERRYKSGDDSSNRGRSGGEIKSACNKSQPLKDIIELIRSHPGGSWFESRTRSQKTKDYKSLIKQHLDINTIEKKLNKGSYVSSSSLLFYRDLKLLFTNAIVFFPPSSSESLAAHELIALVSDELKKEETAVIKAEAESSVSREKSSVPPTLVFRKKRNSALSLKQKDEKKSQEVSESVTASARSLKRTRKGVTVVAKDTKIGRDKNNIKKQTDSSISSEDDDKEEITKTVKKRKISYKKKSAVDFLERIKKNSPEKVKERTTSKDQKKSAVDFLERITKNSPEKVKETRTSKDQKKKSDGNVKKEEKARELRSNSNKSSSKPKQSKKEAEAMGKRSKESEKDNKQPKKKSRR